VRSAGFPRATFNSFGLQAARPLRNVRRHSGVRVCRISLNLSTCPFALRARDWGGRLEPEARIGDGIRLLVRLAEGMGCQLRIESLPGLGTELQLVGPPCARERTGQAEVAQVVALRSEDAEKTP
jgi:hypothetical protein